jgi:hypothetical protein
MKSEFSFNLFFILGFALLSTYLVLWIGKKNKENSINGYKILWGITASLYLLLFLLKSRSFNLPDFVNVLTKSEILLNLTICLGTSFGVFFLLWIRERNKWDLLKGYILFWAVSSSGSIALVQLIFKDYGLSVFTKFLITFCFSLMSTYSPYYLILAKGDKNAKKKLEEMYSKNK